MPPDDADLCIKVDFARSSDNPRRVFDSISLLIDSFSKFDSALLDSIDSTIEPLLLLEDIEAGSIRTWLRNVLRATDDDALKSLDWKQQVGKYLVRSKYAALRWLDREKEGSVPSLAELKAELQNLAAETDVRHLPDYPRVHDARLVPALEKMQEAKRQLNTADRVSIESREDAYEIDLTRRWSPSQAISVDGGRSTFSELELILTLRKPDLLGRTKWVFRHGRSNFVAQIEDERWLNAFYDRQYVILPGDALRCTVKIEYLYDAKGQLKSQNNYITKVHEQISSTSGQPELF